MNFYLRLAIVIVAFFANMTLSSAEKRALVFALSRYEDPSWAVISSVNDLQYVGKLLKAGGFGDITVLRDEKATKAAMVNAFAKLADRCRPGDDVYIHFSGHGQQMTDVDGDEEDGWDEAWIPYDAYMTPCAKDNGSRHLSDDEINVLLRRIRQAAGPESRILVVVDACHSGGSSRRDGDVELPPFRGTDVKFRVGTSSGSQGGINVRDEDWTIISACRDYQVNWELTQPRAGKLTYCLYLLRDRLAHLKDTNIIEEITSLMESPQMQSPIPQEPVLGGRNDGDAVSAIFKLPENARTWQKK
ncbi:MAG: caspase family protein [Candidatus Cryptobacteroides sp.]